MPLESMRPLPWDSTISIFMGCPSSATSLNWLFAFRASAFCSYTMSASPVERPLHGNTFLQAHIQNNCCVKRDMALYMRSC